MKYPWQQPIRPLEVHLFESGKSCLVLFIRPYGDDGWEVMDYLGFVSNNNDAWICNAD
jgi:hypothetical protein